MNYRAWVNQGSHLLENVGIENADLDAWYLLEFCRKKMGKRCDRTWYLLHREEEMPTEEVQVYKKLLNERAERIPLQQITGEQQFMGLEFFVNDQVLIPRQDTETLVEEALGKMPAKGRVLDMCTGSGCILISLLKLHPGFSGVGVDISEGALAVAEENARRLGVQADFLKSDLFEKVEGVFDLMVSNPPYIPTAVIPTLMEEVRDHEPLLALDGCEDGLSFYRELINQGTAFLTPGGWMLFEIGADQAESVTELLKNAGFLQIYTKKDLAGMDRVVGGRKPKQEEIEHV